MGRLHGPRRETNLAVLRAVKEHGYAGKIALTAHHHHDEDVLKVAGADLVLMPFVDAAKEAGEVLLAAATGSPPPTDAPIESSRAGPSPLTDATGGAT